MLQTDEPDHSMNIYIYIYNHTGEKRQLACMETAQRIFLYHDLIQHENHHRLDF